MSVVVVTGFGPYAEEADNPSGAIADRLDGRRAEGVTVRGLVLPVTTRGVESAIAAGVERFRPDALVLTGVAPGRAAPALERVAINVRDFPLPDNDGEEPVDEPVHADGPDGYLSTLPIKAILARWKAAGIPGYVSNTAGTFLCNQAFYVARHLTRNTSAPVGLVHIPATPARAVLSGRPPVPSMDLETLERAVLLAAVVAVRHAGDDLRLPAGAIS
ncbi:peptidase C15 [Actinomadura chibensis]|uniref:Pyroglutamyl-peptidase I n=1 Tax=Actinomadura chibensis TaxID=392828 RepID=A0A5D0N9P2_9ACTN|nr:peptidase C15 [Actinomadura chibensis]TYB41072.1 peptidase C15 [Actinomadura chibensis]